MPRRLLQRELTRVSAAIYFLFTPSDIVAARPALHGQPPSSPLLFFPLNIVEFFH